MSDESLVSLQHWVGSLWAEVIETAPPKPSDSFTGLGGHSLHAVRIVFLLRERLKFPVPLVMLFDAADLAELSRWLQSECDQWGISPELPG